MAKEILMPKQGNSVEACVIVEWRRKVGDEIKEGEVLLEAETDKATIEVESTASGTILSLLYEEGDEVPVMKAVALVGEKGESVEAQIKEDAAKEEDEKKESPAVQKEEITPSALSRIASYEATASPRALNRAAKDGIDIASLNASGPKGRVIEKDVEAASEERGKLTPSSRALIGEEGLVTPLSGSGIGGRITSADLLKNESVDDEKKKCLSSFEDIPLRGIRKVTARRMKESLESTAQLTLTIYADARSLKALRAKFKSAPERLGVGNITINDLVLFAVARTLRSFPDLNAHFLGDRIRRFSSVHLGMATDTERGLMVPVIRNAESLTLKELSSESRRLSSLARSGKIPGDELTGSTLTVSNVGAFGIELFTPVLNIPEVAILGVGGITMRPYEENGAIRYRDSIALSLTVDHQAVDGAPASRFLMELAGNIAELELLLLAY